jgi:hypothetical protein
MQTDYLHIQLAYLYVQCSRLYVQLDCLHIQTAALFRQWVQSQVSDPALGASSSVAGTGAATRAKASFFRLLPSPNRWLKLEEQGERP